MKKFLKKNIFWIILIILALFRFMITTKLTVVQRSDLVVDDEWVVFTAYNLKLGAWQGPFVVNTMIKGISASFILALTSSIKLSYINTVTMLYIFSVFLFIYSIKNIVKNKYLLFIIYLVLLFNPIMFGLDTVQRVYRNSFVPSFSLAIISMYIIMLVNEKNDKNKMILINIVIGIIFALFWNLREDSIWIIPCMIFFGIFVMIKEYKNSKKFLSNIFILLIPVFITVIVNNIICLINYSYYGIYQRLDFSSYTPYTKGYKYMQSIDDDGLTNRVRVTMKKMEKLCEYSPTLNKHKEVLLKYMKQYGDIDCMPKDGEVDNALFMWALRSALFEADVYENAQKANEFWENVNMELQEAVKSGELTISNDRYTSDGIIEMFKALWKTINYTISFNEISVDMDIKSIYIMEIIKTMYEDISLNKMIYKNEDIEEYNVANLYEQNAYLDKYMPIENILNAIICVYQKISVPIFIISLISYLMMSFELAIKRNLECKKLWIIMSGIIGAAFTLMCGIAYTDVFICAAICYTYLAGTYSLIIIFEFIGLEYLIEKINKKGK